MEGDNQKQYICDNKLRNVLLAIYIMCIIFGWLYELNLSYQKIHPTIEPYIQHQHYVGFDAFLLKCVAYGIIFVEGSITGLILGILSPILVPAYGIYSIFN